MTTKIKQKQLLEWNNLDLSPLDMTETRTEGRAFMKYNCSVRQVPEVHKHRPLAASDNFYKVVNVKSVIASAHLRVRKARSRGWISGWQGAHTVTASLAEECFWNSSPTESTSTAADASDSWAETRQTPGLGGESQKPCSSFGYLSNASQWVAKA